MITIPPDSAESICSQFVELWLSTMSEEKWDVAAEMIDSQNCYGVRWGTAEIRASINEYMRNEDWFISFPCPCDRSGIRSFGEFKDGTGYWLDYDVPINDEWSDLTAQFEFKRNGNEYSVSLHDIHVL